MTIDALESPHPVDRRPGMTFMTAHSRQRLGRYQHHAMLSLVLVVWPAGTACNRSPDLPPGVYASPTVRNLGIVADRKEINGEYRIANTSATTVRLLKSIQSCGCTKLQLSTDELPPGGSATATLTVDLEGQFGHKEFEARIETDSAMTPVIRLGLVGDFTVTELDGATEFDLGRFPPSGVISGTFSIFKGSEKAARPTGCDPESIEAVNFALAESENPSFFTVAVSGSAPSNPGPFRLPVDLRAEGGSWGQRRIVFRGSVAPRWTGPEVISIGFLEPGNVVDSSVILRDSSPAPPHPALVRAEATSSADWLKAKATIGAGGEVKVSLSANHPGVAEPVDATVTVTLHTADGSASTWPVAVSGRGL